jgi:hypothetical protein
MRTRVHVRVRREMLQSTLRHSASLIQRGRDDVARKASPGRHGVHLRGGVVLPGLAREFGVIRHFPLRDGLRL